MSNQVTSTGTPAVNTFLLIVSEFVLSGIVIFHFSRHSESWDVGYNYSLRASCIIPICKLHALNQKNSTTSDRITLPHKLYTGIFANSEKGFVNSTILNINKLAKL